MAAPVLKITRGSDLDVTYIIDDDGERVDMTGWSVDWIEIQPPVLTEALSVDISAPAAGEVQVAMPWSDLWPTGANAQIRIRFRLSGLPDAAIPELTVVMT